MSKDDLRFPIGRFRENENFNQELIDECITTIARLPTELRTTVNTLSVDQLSKPYRKDGWTGIQVVHHLADSHMNSLIRFKLTLTEDVPTIKPYSEALWAEMPDDKMLDLEPSLKIVEGVHQRWVLLLKSMSRSDFNREFYHPESDRRSPLSIWLQLYAWHCKHHLGHLHLLSK